MIAEGGRKDQADHGDGTGPNLAVDPDQPLHGLSKFGPTHLCRNVKSIFWARNVICFYKDKLEFNKNKI